MICVKDLEMGLVVNGQSRAEWNRVNYASVAFGLQRLLFILRYKPSLIVEVGEES